MAGFNIPPELEHMPLDERGYPIPYTVLRSKDGTPHFKINDEHMTMACVKDRLCIVCGKPLGNDIWFIGGMDSAFHPRGAFADPPMHKLCGMFSLKICPYLSNTSYRAKGIDPAKLDIEDIKGYYNPTQTDIRLQFFVYLRAKGYTVSPSIPVNYYKPDRPYLEIEFYRHGMRITDKEVSYYQKQEQNDKNAD